MLMDKNAHCLTSITHHRSQKDHCPVCHRSRIRTNFCTASSPARPPSTAGAPAARSLHLRAPNDLRSRDMERASERRRRLAAREGRHGGREVPARRQSGARGAGVCVYQEFGGGEAASGAWRWTERRRRLRDRDGLSGRDIST